MAEKATFGAGCFWHVEAEFRKLKGIEGATAGYSGGNFRNPSYEDVCTDKTGHAEVVQLEFNPGKVQYEKLLDAFWGMHDPTQINRQGPDIGSQYRSVIFYHNEGQKKAAHKSREMLEKSGRYKRKIATEILPAQKFWRAEEYHQRYFEKTGKAACGFRPL